MKLVMNDAMYIALSQVHGDKIPRKLKIAQSKQWVIQWVRYQTLAWANNLGEVNKTKITQINACEHIRVLMNWKYEYNAWLRCYEA